MRLQNGTPNVQMGVLLEAGRCSLTLGDASPQRGLPI